MEAETLLSDAAMNRAESVTAPPSSSVVSGSTELAIVSRNRKDLGEIAKEVDDYFLKAADAGAELSAILEVSSRGFSTETKGGILLSSSIFLVTCYRDFSNNFHKNIGGGAAGLSQTHP